MLRQTKNLIDVCKIQYGYAFDSDKFSDDVGNIALIRIRDVKPGKSQTYYCGSYDDSYVVNSGDILIGMDGEFNIAKWRSGPALLNQRVCRIFVNDDTDEDYLMYYLSVELKKIEARTSFVTVKHLSAKELNALQLKIHNFENQKDISQRLRIVEHIIEKKKQYLLLLDALINSQFMEMFSKYREYSKLENFTSLITKGASPKWQGVEYTDEGTLFVTSENVREGYVDLSKRKYLDNKINKIQPRSVLHKNDILINIVGASIGRAAIYESDELANINQAVALVRVNKKLLNLRFLLVYLNSAYAMKEYESMKRGGARDNLSLNNIANLQIPIIPLYLQQQFATFVQQVDRLKVTIQKSINEMQLLFESLMQKYFE